MSICFTFDSSDNNDLSKGDNLGYIALLGGGGDFIVPCKVKQ